ncbi:hypothetical protein PBCVCan184_574R [Paramecium bursaria Chlorella virus Can18-4]|nr:hypothetical protein PBCVCan184_574R [Paramecium bursaria Chlorella virus Can18-4]
MYEFATVKIHTRGNIITFDDYEINTISVVRRKDTKQVIEKHIVNNYYYLRLRDNKIRRNVKLARAMLTTFVGPPLDKTYTADHIDRDTLNDTLENLRWADKKEQRLNQKKTDTYGNAVIIVFNGEEKTAKEWALEKNITHETILRYASQGKEGWGYKTYDDIDGEIWKMIKNSQTIKSHLSVSNHGRIARYTKNTRKVYDPKELYKECYDYPKISIKGKHVYIHTLVFEAFNTIEYDKEKFVVCHIDDNRENCCYTNLRLGTRSDNGNDAHNNGCYSNTKSQRKSCIATHKITQNVYDFMSISEAVLWLKSIGHTKASRPSIIRCLQGAGKSSYGYTWSTL